LQLIINFDSIGLRFITQTTLIGNVTLIDRKYMSRYIPDLRSSFPTIQNITAEELKRRQEKDKQLSTHAQRRILGRKTLKLLAEQRKATAITEKQAKIDRKRLAKQENKERTRKAIQAGKDALEKIKFLEAQLSKVNTYSKRSYPKYIKGMKSEFYSTKEWRDLRWKVIEKAKGCCAVCGRSRKTNNVIMHVDHKKPRSKYPELELDPTNLQLLCEECNLGKSALIQTF
jgi:5-methylcytosine-specific restriction endonuclease McrA